MPDPWVMQLLAGVADEGAWRDPCIRGLLRNGWTVTEIVDATGVTQTRVEFAALTDPSTCWSTE